MHGIHPRTFSLDPTGRMMAAANLQAMLVRDGDGIKTVPANLATYHVGADGRLKLFNPAFLRSKNLPVPDWLEAKGAAPRVFVQ